MIFAIEGVDRHAYPELFDQMFRMRAAVFADRLGWDVTVVDGKEVDRFDDEDPLYLLCVDELTHDLKGAVRLLPTTGPNMLRDVFSVLVPDGSVESPLIWESSRFAINPTLSSGPDRLDVNRVVNTTTVELLCGLVEAAQLAGVELPHGGADGTPVGTTSSRCPPALLHGAGLQRRSPAPSGTSLLDPFVFRPPHGSPRPSSVVGGSLSSGRAPPAHSSPRSASSRPTCPGSARAFFCNTLAAPYSPLYRTAALSGTARQPSAAPSQGRCTLYGEQPPRRRRCRGSQPRSVWFAKRPAP